MIHIRPVSVKEVFDNANFQALHHEYAEESRITGMPDPDGKVASYKALENTAVFKVFGAFSGDLLIGFVAIIAPELPHYGRTVAVAESLFVQHAYRKTGAGLRLIRTAEDHARAVGSPGLLLSSPTGGRLARVLPRRGYRETNVVFYKDVQDV